MRKKPVKLLDYTQWRNRSTLIKRLHAACTIFGFMINNHYTDVSKTMDMYKNLQRKNENA